MLTIKNFSKAYNNNIVVAVKELRFNSGLHWIKGENGSGKTSFFKSLVGLLPCDGSIMFDDGISLKTHPIEYRLRVNYSEAEPLFPGFLTPKDLIGFVGTARKASASLQNDLIKHFGIDSFYTKPCETFSSGMLKKLSLAMAFLGSPKLIILDEPLITLDESSRNSLFQLIHARIAQGVTFLVSSHQLIEHTDITITGSYSISNKHIVTL